MFWQVNKSLRLTANAIQNYSFEKTDKLPDMADEKDSGISQVTQTERRNHFQIRSKICPDI